MSTKLRTKTAANSTKLRPGIPQDIRLRPEARWRGGRRQVDRGCLSHFLQKNRNNKRHASPVYTNRRIGPGLDRGWLPECAKYCCTWKKHHAQEMHSCQKQNECTKRYACVPVYGKWQWPSVRAELAAPKARSTARTGKAQLAKTF